MLVEVHLAPQAVLSERLAMIRGMHYHSVLRHSELIKRIQQATDLVVQVGYQTVIGCSRLPDLLFRVPVEVERLP